MDNQKNIDRRVALDMAVRIGSYSDAASLVRAAQIIENFLSRKESKRSDVKKRDASK